MDFAGELPSVMEGSGANEDGTDDEGLRIVKGTFSVDTTTNKQPEEIIAEILRVLKQCNIARKRNGYVFSCKALLSRLKQGSAGGDTVMECPPSLQDDDDKKCVKFEIEVCRVGGLSSMCGVCFRRRSGNVWGYKTACKMLRDTFRL